jgi:hypothetical protein
LPSEGIFFSLATLGFRVETHCPKSSFGSVRLDLATQVSIRFLASVDFVISVWICAPLLQEVHPSFHSASSVFIASVLGASRVAPFWAWVSSIDVWVDGAVSQLECSSFTAGHGLMLHFSTGLQRHQQVFTVRASPAGSHGAGA